LFLLTMGKTYEYLYTNDVGELYTGVLSSLPNDPFETGETGSAVLQFENFTPSQTIVPINDCGNRDQANAINVTFVSLSEISYDQVSVVQKIDFEDSVYSVDLNSLYASDPNVAFSLNSGNGVSLNLNFTLFAQSRLLNFANTTFEVNPSTNKWTFDLANWVFLNTKNTLQLEITVAINSGKQFTNVISTGNSGKNMVDFAIVAPDVSFNVALATVAIVDGVIVPIGFILDFNPMVVPYQNPRLLFSLPSFTQSIQYDPNFGVLLGSGAQSSDCGIPGWQIVLIVLAVTISVFFILGTATGVVVYWLKRKHAARRARIEFETVAKIFAETTGRPPAGMAGNTSARSTSPDDGLCGDEL
jgi:hypothetical protein